jgi:hypothetical protein
MMDELTEVLEELAIIDEAWRDSWEVWAAEERFELAQEGF